VLASEILMERWEVATDDLQKLREIIDSNTFAPILEQLQQRSWLMHWSLYISFNHDNGRNQIIDLFFQDRCGAVGVLGALRMPCRFSQLPWRVYCFLTMGTCL